MVPFEDRYDRERLPRFSYARKKGGVLGPLIAETFPAYDNELGRFVYVDRSFCDADSDADRRNAGDPIYATPAHARLMPVLDQGTDQEGWIFWTRPLCFSLDEVIAQSRRSLAKLHIARWFHQRVDYRFFSESWIREAMESYRRWLAWVTSKGILVEARTDENFLESPLSTEGLGKVVEDGERQLQRLKLLLSRGIITNSEYDDKKAELPIITREQLWRALGDNNAAVRDFRSEALMTLGLNRLVELVLEASAVAELGPEFVPVHPKLIELDYEEDNFFVRPKEYPYERPVAESADGAERLASCLQAILYDSRPNEAGPVANAEGWKVREGLLSSVASGEDQARRAIADLEAICIAGRQNKLTLKQLVEEFQRWRVKATDCGVP